VGHFLRVARTSKASVNRPAKSAAAATAAGLSLLFVVVYGGCNWITSQRSDVTTWYYAWERFIPFVPMMIVPYMSIDLFFVAAPFVCRSCVELRILVQRITFAILVAGVFFLFVPLQLAVERPQAQGLVGAIFTFLHGLDQPHNLFPSLHITLRTILADLYARHTKGAMRAAVQVWFSLIGVSTLLTYQHHFVDVAGGFLLALICCYLFCEHQEHLPVTPNYRVGGYYAAGTLTVGVAAWMGWPWTAILLWPTLALALTTAAYWGIGPSIYRKTNGRLPISARLVLAPCLIGQQLSLLYYRRSPKAWDAITPRVWISARLSETEAAEARCCGVTAVLDLTAEFSETAGLRSLEYLNLPALDLTAPTPAQLDGAVRFITRHAGSGIVCVHCKAGYSRSAAAVGAYLLSLGRARTVEEALAMLRAARPAMVIRPEVRTTLEAFHAASRQESACQRPRFHRSGLSLPCQTAFCLMAEKCKNLSQE
jgi:membrane-associated phospholipid phosphatase/predicted protein tyrosine phosphatase